MAAAATLNGDSDKTVRDSERLDVTPLSLGLGTIGDVMTVMIPRNTPIPTSCTKTLTTTKDDLSSMLIQVYQGERTKSTDNYLLGKFSIYGIPIAPKGVEKVKACFEIDANGILKVTAKVLSTGKIENITITNVNGRPSEKAIDKVIENPTKYRFEDQEYQRKLDAYNVALKNRVKDYTIRKKQCLDILKSLEDAIAEDTKWLSVNQAPSTDELTDKAKELEKLDYKADAKEPEKLEDMVKAPEDQAKELEKYKEPEKLEDEYKEPEDMAKAPEDQAKEPEKYEEPEKLEDEYKEPEKLEDEYKEPEKLEDEYKAKEPEKMSDEYKAKEPEKMSDEYKAKQPEKMSDEYKQPEKMSDEYKEPEKLEDEYKAKEPEKMSRGIRVPHKKTMLHRLIATCLPLLDLIKN